MPYHKPVSLSRLTALLSNQREPPERIESGNKVHPEGRPSGGAKPTGLRGQLRGREGGDSVHGGDDSADRPGLRGCDRRNRVRPSGTKPKSRTKDAARLRGSSLKGVSYRPFGGPSGDYVARKQVSGIEYFIGTFMTPEEAHQAYLNFNP